MTAHFSLLGPLDVRVGGRNVEIQSSKLRILLAALLLNARRPVTSAELAEAIWGSSQPEHPRRAVQLYATRLRAIDPAFDELIVTCPGGYRIDVPPHQLDLERFDDHLKDADDAVAERDLELEAKALTDALALRRGEPLTDVPSDLLRRDIGPRWQERHLATLERYFDVELRRGRHFDIIGDLLTVTGEHPFRERLWVQLITALHRNGRRADALDAYHLIRQRLSSELGIDPGVDLQDLHTVILTGREVPVPRQIPPAVHGFVGRESYLAELDGHADGICVITGTPGVGKTSLAIHWARKVAERFPDGQLWVDLRGYGPQRPTTTRQALTRCLRSLGVADAQIPVDVADQTGLYRSLMDGRRMLVVLDNANTAEQVRPLLPGGPGCLVVVTSRNQLSELVSAESASSLMLDLFRADEARNLFVKRLGRQRVDAEPEAVETLIQLCARLPLALAIVAARIASRPQFKLEIFAEQLAMASGTITARAFSWSYRTLTPAARRLFRLLGSHPGPDIGEAAAAALAGVRHSRVRTLLAELCELHLVTEYAPGRYSFHDLLRAYAMELDAQDDSDPERFAGLERVLDHYLHTASRASLLLNPHRETRISLGSPVEGSNPKELLTSAEAIDWLNAEHAVLLDAVKQAARHGFEPHAWKLSWALAVFLDRYGHWGDQFDTTHVGLEAACHISDLVGQATAHRGLGNACMHLGDFDQACDHLQQAATLFESLGDLAGQASAYRGIAATLSRQGEHQLAARHAQNAYELFRKIADRDGQAHALNAIGWYQALAGDFDGTLEACGQALSLMREVGDQLGEAGTLDSLGYAHHHLKQHSEAAKYYREALTLAEEVRDPYYEATILDHLGDAHLAMGSTRQARTAWDRSLAKLERLDHPDAAAIRTKLDLMRHR